MAEDRQREMTVTLFVESMFAHCGKTRFSARIEDISWAMCIAQEIAKRLGIGRFFECKRAYGIHFSRSCACDYPCSDVLDQILVTMASIQSDDFQLEHGFFNPRYPRAYTISDKYRADVDVALGELVDVTRGEIELLRLLSVTFGALLPEPHDGSAGNENICNALETALALSNRKYSDAFKDFIRAALLNSAPVTSDSAPSR